MLNISQNQHSIWALYHIVQQSIIPQLGEKWINPFILSLNEANHSIIQRFFVTNNYLNCFHCMNYPL